MTTPTPIRKQKKSTHHRNNVTRRPHAAQQRHHEPPQEPEEGAGSNDERELPEQLKQDIPASGDHRPPTNSVPDRPQDPARPNYKEPHPKDKIINTLGYDPNSYPYESPDFIDVSVYDVSTGHFNGASFL